MFVERGSDRMLGLIYLQRAFVSSLFLLFLCHGVGWGIVKKIQEELRGFQHTLEAEVEEERRQAEHQLKLLARNNEVELQEVTCKVVSMVSFQTCGTYEHKYFLLDRSNRTIPFPLTMGICLPINLADRRVCSASRVTPKNALQCEAGVPRSRHHSRFVLVPRKAPALDFYFLESVITARGRGVRKTFFPIPPFS